ncbi:MAG TPA: response regulator [Thermomicrobiaceae bacterium]|nr:response regulator [Thermomicrobiaceae bacterium]
MHPILVVDDDSSIRGLIREILEIEGYVTVEVTNGRDAVTAARASRPGMIIMDLRMPVMDGVTAIRMLRADPATAPIPIIALSAGLTLLAIARTLPIEGLLSKPFELDDLVALVRRHLEPDAIGAAPAAG